MLEIDVSLLFLRYGKDVVLDCIRQLEERSADEVAAAVSALSKGAKKRQPRKSALDKALEIELQRRPDLAEPLRVVAANFDSKRFLPNLRDVRRFLEKLGRAPETAKTRAQAGPVLLQALCELSRDELAEIASASNATGESGLALLTRAILHG
ncbi:MAG TPA: hypothetical protein VJY39_23225 [Acidisphaera sp.]|nr:hypothetical protein [Acidisphaera sp.]